METEGTNKRQRRTRKNIKRSQLQRSDIESNKHKTKTAMIDNERARQKRNIKGILNGTHKYRLNGQSGYTINVRWDNSLIGDNVLGSASWDTGYIWLNPDNQQDTGAKFNDNKNPETNTYFSTKNLGIKNWLSTCQKI